MFILKCEYCGFEQVIKKQIDKYTYYELTHCKHLWCPCNKCKEEYPRPKQVEKGMVKHGWVLGEWDCLLTEKDAAYVQPHQNYGIWSKRVNPTTEDYKAIKRARELRDMGLMILQKDSDGTTE